MTQILKVMMMLVTMMVATVELNPMIKKKQMLSALSSYRRKKRLRCYHSTVSVADEYWRKNGQM